MAVQDVRVQAQGVSETWAALRTDHTGRRLVVVLGNRANGSSATVTTDQSELLSLTQRLQHIPSGGGSKSLHVFEAIIPEFSGNPILGSEVLDDGDSPVDHARLAFVVDEDYEFAAAASSDSGSSSVTSWDTGETTSVPAGDLLVIAAGTSRGTTTVAWDITDAEPPNPEGGAWLLQVEQSGSAASMRTAFAGYAALPGQSAQTWEDTLTLGTARETSVGIVVFSTGDGNGGQEDHSGTGVPAGITMATAAGVGTPGLTGAGVPAGVTLAASPSSGSLAVESSGAPASTDVIASTGTGSPAVTQSGVAASIPMMASVGTGTTETAHAGTGASALVAMVAAVGTGTPSIVGGGDGATVTLTAGIGTGSASIPDTDPVAFILGDVDGPARIAQPTPTGLATRRMVTGPALSRTLTGPER